MKYIVAFLFLIILIPHIVYVSPALFKMLYNKIILKHMIQNARILQVMW